MALELIDEEAEALVNETKKLLEILADAWDPGQFGTEETAEVSNKHLQKADSLSKKWRKLRWRR